MEIAIGFGPGQALQDGFADAEPVPEEAAKRRDLDEFCREYRERVLRFVRQAWSKTPEDAEDLTQAFFLWVLETDPLARYSPERGGFWSFIKSLLRHFCADRHDALRALKRGGAVRTFPLDRVPASEGAPAGKPAAEAEDSEDRAWRMEVLRGAVERARRWYRSSGRALQFRVFEEHDLGADGAGVTYLEVAARLGIGEGRVRNYLFGVREKVRSEVRAEISRRESARRALVG